MAKLIIRGAGEVEISQERYNYLKPLWDANLLKGKRVDLGDAGSFEGVDIRAIVPDQKQKDQEQSEYNLFDEAQKAKVKCFENEFENWKAAHSEFTEWQEYHYLEAMGLIKMGATRPDDTIIDIGDRNKKYFEMKKLFASLQTLKYYREKAQANNDPDFEAKRVAMFKAMKEKMFGKRECSLEAPILFHPIQGGLKFPKVNFIADNPAPKQECQHNWFSLKGTTSERLRQCQNCGITEHNPIPNPALAQIKADAQKFDEANGIVGDIDPALIPF